MQLEKFQLENFKISNSLRWPQNFDLQFMRRRRRGPGLLEREQIVVETSLSRVTVDGKLKMATFRRLFVILMALSFYHIL